MSGRWTGVDIGSLSYVICGAAPISPEVFRRFQEMTGANIQEGYGLTEGTLSSSANPKDGEKRLGLDRYPHPLPADEMRHSGRERSARPRLRDR